MKGQALDEKMDDERDWWNIQFNSIQFYLYSAFLQ